MITVEELAKEIISGHIIGPFNAKAVASHIFPFIERHIAERELAAVAYAVDEMQRVGHLTTPQPPKPAECAIECPPMQVCDHCAWPPGKDKEPPKDAGAVPMPEVIAYRQTVKYQSDPFRIDTFVFPVDVHPKPNGSEDVCTLADAIRYGNDREAAGRADAMPEGYVLAPHFRGFAHLGLGRYLLFHSHADAEAELSIVPATPEAAAGRTVGDLRDDGPDEIPAELMAVRLRFENVAGLDALEQQLRLLRETHFLTPPTKQEGSAP